jgi:hypothetical protein
MVVAVQGPPQEVKMVFTQSFISQLVPQMVWTVGSMCNFKGDNNN